MSFGFSTEAVDPKYAVQAIADAYEGYPGVSPKAMQHEQGTGVEADEYVALAAGVAMEVVEAMSPTAAQVRVHVSGHVNPGHLHWEGWANDFINVQVSIATYR